MKWIYGEYTYNSITESFLINPAYIVKISLEDNSIYLKDGSMLLHYTYREEDKDKIIKMLTEDN